MVIKVAQGHWLTLVFFKKCVVPKDMTNTAHTLTAATTGSLLQDGHMEAGAKCENSGLTATRSGLSSIINKKSTESMKVAVSLKKNDSTEDSTEKGENRGKS